MTQKKKLVQMWVHPSFKTKIKLESIKKNMNIVDYTKFVGGDYEGNELIGEKKKERGFKIGF